MKTIICPRCNNRFEVSNDTSDFLYCPSCQFGIDLDPATPSAPARFQTPDSIGKAHTLLWIAAGINALVALIAENIVGVIAPLLILGGLATSIKKGSGGRFGLSILFPFILLFSGLGGLSMMLSGGGPGVSEEVRPFLPVVGFVLLVYFGLYTWALVLVWTKPSRDWFRHVKEERKKAKQRLSR